MSTSLNNFKEIEDGLQYLQPYIPIRVGGAGNKILYMIDGHAESVLYMTKGMKNWDMCAPEALLRAQLGVVTDKDLNKIEYDP